MDNGFIQGALMAMKLNGVKDEQEQQKVLQELYKAQAGNLTATTKSKQADMKRQEGYQDFIQGAQGMSPQELLMGILQFAPAGTGGNMVSSLIPGQEEPPKQWEAFYNDPANTGLSPTEKVKAFKGIGQVNKPPNLQGDVGEFYDMYGRKPSNMQELVEFKKSKRLPPQPTLSERETLKRIKSIDNLKSMDPNVAYMEHGYKMNEDGSLYLDPVSGAPEKLPPFHKVMGKRGQIKAMKGLGENWDDSKQLMALLQDPKVQENLTLAEQEVGFWDRVKGKWNNKILLWLQKRGIAKNSKTYEAITRMQRLASQERKEYLGVAVTGTELESTLAWMPNAGDSLSTMLNKANLMVTEGEEVFTRYLDIYKNVANMGPFYKAFGLKRFSGDKPTGQNVLRFDSQGNLIQ